MGKRFGEIGFQKAILVEDKFMERYLGTFSRQQKYPLCAMCLYISLHLCFLSERWKGLEE